MMDAIDRVEGLLGHSKPLTAKHGQDLAASVGEFFEFAALRWHVWRDRNEDLLDLLPPSDNTRLNAASSRETGVALLDLVRDREAPEPPTDIDGLAMCEVPLDTEGWQAGGAFSRFEEAFKDALVVAGLPTRTAHALAGALDEVASNASEHARPPIPPLAAFEVGTSSWAFCVADVGRGARASLRDNPAFASLPNDLAALRTALEPGASATGEAGRGHGYRYFFKALVDRSCRLRIRSGAALARWTGTSPTEQELRWRKTAAYSGFQVTVRSGPS